MAGASNASRVRRDTGRAQAVEASAFPLVVWCGDGWWWVVVELGVCAGRGEGAVEAATRCGLSRPRTSHMTSPIALATPLTTHTATVSGLTPVRIGGNGRVRAGSLG